jgi:CheY-like chemotaxis protein
MKLDAIPAATVRKAVEAYLGLAYPGTSRWRAPPVDLSGGATARDLLPRFEDESEKGARAASRFVLRLGNNRYPHMKLVLEESILPEEFAFAVDTHDDLKVSPGSPDFERWNAVRTHNRELAGRIEARWREEGIPTLADIKCLIGTVEPLTKTPHSVLVVDDDPSICDAIRELLERAGMRVRTAPNGRAALDSVAREPPHLILMDYQMPDMDGVTACEALKGTPATAAIPVLLATRSQVDLSSLTFADGFLVKPYRQDVLFSLVRKLLS